MHDFDLEPSKNLREIMLAQKLYSTQHHRLHCVRQPLPSDPSVRKLLGFQRDAHTPAEAASEMSQLGNDWGNSDLHGKSRQGQYIAYIYIYLYIYIYIYRYDDICMFIF